jgi:hypothetical protein
MAKAPKRQKSDGLYNNNTYKQRKGYGSKELRILNNQSDSGYATGIPNISAENNKTWNAALIAPFGAYVKLWVTEVQMDFSVSGVVGQSRYRRQFFPRSFNQPKVMVSGTMPNQKEYNRLAAFIRECHFEALTGDQNLYAAKDNQSQKSKRSSSQSIQTITLVIKDAGLINRKSAPRNIKGGHKAIQMDGYIKMISSGAVRFNFAPNFNFEFIPVSSKVSGSLGIYEDAMEDGSEIMAWMDIFKSNGLNKNIADPNASKPVK